MGTVKGIAKRVEKGRMKEGETERSGKEILLILFILLLIQQHLRGSYLLLGIFQALQVQAKKKITIN